ncbi:MAG TPA: hypothetical protein DHV36_09580 [Desulfobacteraceae bacterium]|nr:hypothetical protein [Desulfobacteraceae bacterium]
MTPPRPHNLLTPEDVADLLQVSVKTVYKHKRRLCGFHPAGLRCLRFRRESIYDIMEGRGQVAISVPDVRGSSREERVSDETRGRRRRGRTPKAAKKAGTDPSRHGL